MLAVKLFQFCDLKTQQRYTLQEEVNISKRDSLLVDSLRDFLETCDHASKCNQTPLQKHTNKIGSTKSKNSLFALCYNDIIEPLNRQNRFFSDLETIFSAYFSSKSFNCAAINSFLLILSTLTIAKFTISTRSDNTLQTSVK